MPRSTKIFVGNIAIGTSAEELSELFSQFGQVTECDVLGVGNYAFVHIAGDAEADAAINELRNYSLNGSVLNIEKSTSETQGRKRKEAAGNFRSSPGRPSGIPRRNTTKIFVGNIKHGTTNDELRAVFEHHGAVAEADVCGGYGFVHMQSQADAIKAIKGMNGYYLNGNLLNVELSTEATQGRSSVPIIPNARGGRGGGGGRDGALVRGRGNLLQVGKRYDPYSKLPLGGPAHRNPHAADPYASASYGNGLDPYGVSDFSADLYGSTSRALTAGPSRLSSDSFARDLLNLYVKNPAAFDNYAKDPMIQQSLNLGGFDEADDPYYRPPKEYYDAKNTGLLPLRTSGFDDGFGSTMADSYAPVSKRPLLPIGSGRGLAGVGMSQRGLDGPFPLGAPGVWPRATASRPALYTSFE